MKQVVVYNVEEHHRTCYDSQEFLTLCSWQPMNNFAVDAPMEQFVERQDLPIKHYHLKNGKELWAVFSPELLEVLDIEIAFYKDLKHYKYLAKTEKYFSGVWKKKYDDLYEESRKVHRLGLWGRLKFLFTGRIQ